MERNNGSTYGKCSERCDIPMAPDTHEKLTILAYQNGMSRAEYARIVLEQHVYGAAARIKRCDPLLG